MDEMLFFERKYGQYLRIAGVDEAGAGPLAGPVAAAAVILPRDFVIEKMKDSKKLTAKQREAFGGKILENAVAYSVAYVDNVEIDEINILQARLKAMKLAVEGLDPPPDFVMFDGSRVPSTLVPHIGIEGGDARSMSIAAASVLAKVSRDALMLEYHEKYPEYGFDRHKGYGTALHFAAIKAHGLTPIHRRTFISKETLP